MNKIPLTNQTTFRILYFKYKPFFLPIGVILVSVLLFFTFIIPQFQAYLTLQSQKEVLADRVGILTDNFNFISSMDTSILDKNLKIVTDTLPQSKDFSQVLDAISNASVTAGVRLGDYSFQLGNLNVGKDSNLQLSVIINGGLIDVSRFITALKRQLPLSDVLEVRVSGENSTVSMVFFYKPLAKISFQPSTPLEHLTKKDTSLLKDLETMSLSSIAGPTLVGTDAALQQ